MVLSADTDTERVAKCLEIGADDYLPKPFNPIILRARITSELRKRSLRSLESEYLGRIEQEKKHSEALLRNILPPEIAIAPAQRRDQYCRPFRRCHDHIRGCGRFYQDHGGHEGI